MTKLAPLKLAAAALTLAVMVSPAVAKKDDPRLSEWKATGETEDCITPSSIRNTHVINDQTIDFEMLGGDVYRNTLPNKCPSLGFEKRFSYRTSISQLCSVDIITVLFTAGPGLQPGASCGLGKFQPMVKAPK